MDRLSSARAVRVAREGQEAKRADLPGEEYPGDDGDWLIWCLSAEPATLNEIHDSGGMGTRWITSGNIFESLLEYNPDEYKLRGLLAESWDVSDDGMEVYFKIREDAHFSDGRPVTADDVIFTFIDNKTPSSLMPPSSTVGQSHHANPHPPDCMPSQ